MAYKTIANDLEWGWRTREVASSTPGRSTAATLGKLFTLMCFCLQTV